MRRRRMQRGKGVPLIGHGICEWSKEANDGKRLSRCDVRELEMVGRMREARGRRGRANGERGKASRKRRNGEKLHRKGEQADF